MSTIDATQGLAALMRERVRALRTAGTAPTANPSVAVQTRQIPDLRRAVALRVQALSPDDPERRRKALRIYLESTLLRGLGLDLAHDPRFADMLDAVQGQMEADEALSAAAGRLVDVLLAPTGSAP